MNSAEWDVVARLPGWCTQGKAIHLQHLVGQLAGAQREPIRCAEVGVYGGRSLIAIALGLRDRGLGGFVLGIDPYSPTVAAADAESEKAAEWWRSNAELEKAHAVCLSSIEQLRLSEWCAVARTEGWRLAQLLSGLALAHIDGAHSEAAAMRDVQAFLPTVRSGGMVVLDDADWASLQPAVSWLSNSCDLVSREPTYSVFRKR